jgi:hypothetical protein
VTQLPLFNDDTPPAMPASEYKEPAVWVRRLRIVRELKPDAEVIREVTFRRGVNIIGTAERLPDEERTVGHSVGKTLLLRLIRFCLGERAFCTQHTREAIAHWLPHAYVLAEVMILGEPWAIARPIGLDSSRTASFSARSSDLNVLLMENANRLTFGPCEQALNDATTLPFRAVVLPYARRPIQWLDILAWLSRDQGCRYRSHTEWRTQATERAGSALRAEDIHIVIRTVMGLILPDEMELVLRRKQLERDRGTAVSQVENLKRILQHLQAELSRSLELPADLLGDEAFATRAAEEARDKRDSLKGLLTEMEANDPTLEAEGKYQGIRDDLAKAQGALTVLKAEKEIAKGRLRQLREADANDELFAIAELDEWCHLFITKAEAMRRGCPGTPDQRAPGIPDPHRAALIRKLEEEMQSLDRRIAPITAQVDQCAAKESDAASGVRAARAKYDDDKGKVRRKAGYYLALADRASQYRKTCDALRQAKGRRDVIEKELAETLEARKAARGRVRTMHALLSDHFDRTLKQMLGEFAGGRIDIDSNGIFPRPTAETRAGGDAMSTSATVLGFDIACLVAAVGGLGHLPRLWLHDSPREADMETPMFHRVFRPIAELENLFAEQEPAFQYIMTTTTPPPKELNNETYVRIVLDARDDNGLLLKQRY